MAMTPRRNLPMTRRERLGLSVCAFAISLLIFVALMLPRRQAETSAPTADRIDTIHVAAPTVSGATPKAKKHKTAKKPLPQRNPLDEKF